MADIEFEIKNGVLWMTLNRPEQMGAMTSEMRDQIIAKLEAAQTDPDVRSIVLTGRGNGFCSGADLSRPAGAPADEPRLPPERLPDPGPVPAAPGRPGGGP